MTTSQHKSKKSNQIQEAKLTSLAEFDNHEFVMVLTDAQSGLKSYIAIHNTNRGPALGGTRMKPYNSEQEALSDVLNLSKAMSYKCALANLPYGGGKAVIVANDISNRKVALTKYAQLVEKLRGLFKTGTDVGISDEDVVHMAGTTKHMLGVVAADRGSLSTSKVAALGVFYGARAALQHLYGSNSFENRSVAIKGAGKLGGELARLVIDAGGKVVISDVNESALRDLKNELPGITIVGNEEVHTQQVDIYAPCALGGEFSHETVEELNCKAIVGGANNQLANDNAGDLIHSRNILYAPDYVANAGGLIYVADELEPGGFNKERVLARTQEIESTLNLIFSEAAKTHRPTHKVADEIALERIEGAGHAQ